MSKNSNPYTAHEASIARLVAEAAAGKFPPAHISKELRDLFRNGILDAEGRTEKRRPTPRAAPEKQVPACRPKLVNAASVTPEPVTWTWFPYLPAGKVCLLTGDPGEGKSAFATWIAARLSNGDRLPGHEGDPEPIEPSRTLILCQEDGLADTLRPRLDAAGADPSMVDFLQVGTWTDAETGEEKEFELTFENLDLIESAIAQTEARFVVIDPVQSFMPAGVDSHKMTEVRQAIKGLATLAERYGCTILLLRHRVKSTSSTRGKLQGQGSVDFTAFARSELIAAARQKEDGTTERLVFHSKHNLSAPGDTIKYGIGTFTNGPIVAAVFEYLGTSLEDLDETLTGEGGSRALKVEEAEDFIVDAVAGGWCAVSDLVKQADAAAIKPWAVKAARKRLMDQQRITREYRREPEPGWWIGKGTGA